MKYERIVQIVEGEAEESSPAVKVIMTIDRRELEAPYNEYLNRIKRSRKFNGFRPGKVPNYIVEGRYGKEATDHVITTMVESNIRDIAKEHGDTVLFRPVFYPFQKPDATNNVTTHDMVFEVIYFRKVTFEGVVGPLGITEPPRQTSKGNLQAFIDNPELAVLKIQSDNQKLIDAAAD